MVVVGAALGSGIGLLTGLTVGNFLIKPQPKTYEYLDAKADHDPTQETIRLGEIVSDARDIHPYLPKWTYWPDYERVRWINSIIKIMWPYVNEAVCQTVLDGLVPTLQDVADKFWFLEAIAVEKMDLGRHPMSLGGMKAYHSRDDEAILECPMQWGSDAVIRVGATLRLGPVSIYVPLEVRDIQFMATARITIRPLVETLPCVGALGISLLDPPHMDMALYPLGMGDIMALPGVKLIVDQVVKSVVGGLVLYPRDMIFPVMEDGGVPKPPSGMLEVHLASIDNLTVGGDLLSKVDPYVLLEIREGRGQKSKTIDNDNNPKYNETFRLIVDDLDNQMLSLVVYDDDAINDTKIALTQLWFMDPNTGAPAEFVTNPRSKITVRLPLYKPTATGLRRMGTTVTRGATKGIKSVARGMSSLMGRGKKTDKIASRAVEEKQKKDKSIGTVNLVISYYPFQRHDEYHDDDDEEADAQARSQLAVKSLNLPSSISKVTDKSRGVLTVTLIRASNLASADGVCNPYVELKLVDQDKDGPIVQKSAQVVNDSAPRWGSKFDFVDVTAGSTIYFSVYDKPGVLDSVTSTLGRAVGMKKAEKLLGLVRVPVMDVVRNTRLKDQFALQQAQQGVLDIKLEWQPVEYQ